MRINRKFDDDVPELVDVLQGVDEDDDDADLNATTISDNNGGRIELDFGKYARKVAKIFRK